LLNPDFVVPQGFKGLVEAFEMCVAEPHRESHRDDRVGNLCAPPKGRMFCIGVLYERVESRKIRNWAVPKRFHAVGREATAPTEAGYTFSTTQQTRSKATCQTPTGGT